MWRTSFNVSYLLAYLIGTFVLIGLGYLWSRRIAHLSLTTSTVYVMGMSMSNQRVCRLSDLVADISSCCRRVIGAQHDLMAAMPIDGHFPILAQTYGERT